MITLRYKVAGRFTRLWERVRQIFGRYPRTILKPNEDYTLEVWVKPAPGEEWRKRKVEFVTPSKGEGTVANPVTAGETFWGTQLNEGPATRGPYIRGQ